MGVLVLDVETHAAAARVREYAESHPYDPALVMAGLAPLPGDRPEYVWTSGSYRVVFTITLHRGCYRHLSISMPGKDAAPNPIVVAEIANLFGFTGWEPTSAIAKFPGDWIVGRSECERGVIIVAQAFK